jgi:hypothetical protein
MGKKGLWFLARAVAMLFLIGLLVAGGFALHYISWSRGYTAGQLTAEGEEVATPPYFPGDGEYYKWHMRPMMHRPFGAVGALFKIGLGILCFAIIVKLIRFVFWGSMFHHAMAGPWGKHWCGPHGRRAYRRHARWHRRHGPPMPPWCWDWDEDEEAEEADDEPATGN